jgi:GntR family transcriptional regulator
MLDKNNPIPLYLQLKNELLLKIKNYYDNGELFLNEPQIEKEFDVSRITVRKAMDLLSEEGLLVKQRGRGTFVNKDKLSISNTKKIHSWKEDVKKSNMNPTNKIIDIIKVEASKNVASRLNIANGEEVLRIRRLCYANDILIMKMTNYVNPNLLNHETDFKMINDSLYYTLEHVYKLNIDKSTTIVEARMPSSKEITDLELKKNIPVLDMITTTYDNFDRVIETTEIVANSDRYKFIAG